MKKIIRTLLVSVVMMMLMTITAFAESTVKVELAEKVQVGTEYAVTITITTDTEVSEISGNFDYPSASTEYVSGADEVVGGGKVRLTQATAQTADNKTFTWTLTYKATAANAEAKFAVQQLAATAADAAAGEVTFPAPQAFISEFTTEVVEVPTEAPAATETVGSAVVTVTEAPVEDAAKAAWLQKEQEILADTNNLTALILTDDLTVEKIMYVATTYRADELPLHFHEERCVYKGVEIKGAQLNGTDIMTVYVTDANGGNGEWVYYDQTKESAKFEKIKRISTETGVFLLLLDPEEDQIPENFTETTLPMGLESYKAWTTGSTYVEGGAAANPAEFYLVYGCNQGGHEGWYIYDSTQSSFLRYVEFTGSAVDQEPADDADVSGTDSELAEKYEFIMKYAKYAGIAIIALLIILLIVNLSGRKDDYDEDYEDEEVDESEEEEVPMTRKERKAAEKAAKKARLEEAKDEDGFVDDYNLKDSPKESDYIKTEVQSEQPVAKEKKSSFDDADESLGALKPLLSEELAAKNVDAVMETLTEAPNQTSIASAKDDQIARLLDSVSEDIRKTVESEKTKEVEVDIDSDLTFIDIEE